MENKSDKKQAVPAPGGKSLENPNSMVQLSNEKPVIPKPDEISDGRSVFVRIIDSRHLYAWVFLLVVIAAAGIVLALTRWSADGTNKATGNQSLSAQQLQSLASSTVSVGSSDQTLNVRGSAIFQNQVLLKQGLDVAGSIKIGGSISLPSISVSGNSSFGQLQVNNTLSVSGNTVVQGQLTLQKNLTVAGSGSFGSLSASQLNVSTLQLTGDLSLAHHLVTTGNAPAKSNGGSLGSGGTASFSGNDTAGTITINTGGGPAAGCFVTLNFAQKFAATPHVVVSPSNSNAGGIDYYTNRSSTGFSVCDAGTPAAGTTYLFDYFVSG